LQIAGPACLEEFYISCTSIVGKVGDLNAAVRLPRMYWWLLKSSVVSVLVVSWLQIRIELGKGFGASPD